MKTKATDAASLLLLTILGLIHTAYPRLVLSLAGRDGWAIVLIYMTLLALPVFLVYRLSRTGIQPGGPAGGVYARLVAMLTGLALGGVVLVMTREHLLLKHELILQATPVWALGLPLLAVAWYGAALGPGVLAGAAQTATLFVIPLIAAVELYIALATGDGRELLPLLHQLAVSDAQDGRFWAGLGFSGAWVLTLLYLRPESVSGRGVAAVWAVSGVGAALLMVGLVRNLGDSLARSEFLPLARTFKAVPVPFLPFSYLTYLSLPLYTVTIACAAATCLAAAGRALAVATGLKTRHATGMLAGGIGALLVIPYTRHGWSEAVRWAGLLALSAGFLTLPHLFIAARNKKGATKS